MNMCLKLMLFVFTVCNVPAFSSQIALEPFDEVVQTKAPAFKSKKQAPLKNLVKLANVTPLKISYSLQALALTANAFDYSGRGNARYWMRVAEDFSTTGHELGAAYLLVAKSMPAGPARTVVESIGTELAALRAGNRGNVDYWMNRAEFIAEEVSSKSKQIIAISSRTGEETMKVSVVLKALSNVLGSYHSSGNGDVDYWMRVVTNENLLADAGSSALNDLNKHVDADLAAILASYVKRLDDIDISGKGNVDYWMARASDINEQLNNVSRAVAKISKTV